MPRQLLITIDTLEDAIEKSVEGAPKTKNFPWVIVDSDQPTSNTSESGVDSLHEISGHAQNCEVILLLSGIHCYTTQVSLATTNLNQLKKAIPYALEEELSENVEHLHFACGPIVKDKPIAVAVIKKESIVNLLARFDEVGITPACLIPDFFALPYKENCYHLLLLDQHALVRTGRFSGFSIAKDQLTNMLALTTSKTDTATQTEAPTQIIAIDLNSEADAILKEHSINGIPIITDHSGDNDFVSYAAHNISETNQINLLQGSFKTAHKTALTAHKLWRITALLAVIWLTLAGMIEITSYFYYRTQQNRLQKEIATLYKQVFPQAVDVVAPKIRIERELEKYQHQTNDDGFLETLSKVAPAIKASASIELINMAYQSGQLTLSVKSSSFQLLQRFSDQISKAGIQLIQKNAASHGDSVTADLIIKGVGS